MLDRDTFIRRTADQLGVSPESLLRNRGVVTCGCGGEWCAGWKLVALPSWMRRAA